VTAPLPPLHVVRAGEGPPVVLVHGSATDYATWSIQMSSSLGQRFGLLAYDRRGSGKSMPVGPWSVESHAADLADLISREGAPAVVVGSSFGAVVGLELARRFPGCVRGVVMCEPPLPPRDDAPAMPDGFLTELDALAASGGGGAAVERFLRLVLGDGAYERMPRLFQERCKQTWPALRSDVHALAAYRVRYAQLAAVNVPVLLLGGDRSADYFGPTLRSLLAELPRATYEVLTGAGHMMHADAHKRFGERVAAFCAEVGHTAGER
jgi:pimeloyl-ACP methyl ester carboxylesterase